MILPEHLELEQTVSKLSQQLLENEGDDFFEKMGIIHDLVEKYVKLNSAKAPNSEYEATPKSCRTCINKCSLITQQGCKNNGYFMWEEA